MKSYDIAIYDNEGKEVWKKVDQPGLGGRGAQDIAFGGNVTGPITIKISDITPGWLPSGSSETNSLTDSVAFSTSVVPEFPVAALLFAAAIATIVGTLRFKSRIA